MKKNPTIDRYEVIRGLGKGAWGSVYLGYDPKLDRNVAIKVLNKESYEQPKYRARFEREARAIAALRHPNIVEIYDYGITEKNRMYIVMEYITGPHLGLLEREYGPLPETIALSVAHELCSALTLAHENSIIHRDLKPENVFIKDGRVVLADFGITKAINTDSPLGEEAADPMTEIIGTPGFMAPEQLQQKPLGNYTDIFSTGALLYFLSTGNLAYDASSPYELLNKMHSTAPIPVHEKRPILSPVLSKIIQTAMDLDVDNRYDSTEDLRQNLAKLLTARGIKDIREELVLYQKNPESYVETDRQRVVNHAIDRFHLALAEQNTTQSYFSYDVVKRLLPESAIPLKQALQQLHPNKGPKALLLGISLGLIISLIIGSILWLFIRPMHTHLPIARVFIHSRIPTEILHHSKSYGKTPTVTHIDLQGAHIRLVFRTPHKPALEYVLSSLTDNQTHLYIDWKQRRIVKKGPKKVNKTQKTIRKK